MQHYFEPFKNTRVRELIQCYKTLFKTAKEKMDDSSPVNCFKALISLLFPSIKALGQCFRRKRVERAI
ncbi:Uncharacterized protein APZ42_012454 [Daphnia magna]|uniref:Uncharacterized protein n=1 Tax=Daphnia magna TaxID=35525 RepID=A0A162RTU4_9CRUS|nr:Uncharacterized protein APZ42_012454 [Daphnia magna]